MIKKTTVYRKSTFTSYAPLFTGYVFLHGSDNERVLALTTKRIAQVLVVTDYDRLCRELRQIHQLIASDASLTIESRLTAGVRVRVRFGPLQGLEGTALTRRGKTRVLVSVDFLQQGASIEFDDYLLEPIG